MGESLASFRDLKGIGPATEARLHETGIYTWEALAAAAAALASVRGHGDTLREIASAVAARRTEADGDDNPRPPDGERLEAFVLRMSLTADGVPQRSEVTHVRTMAEQAWSGWRPTELAPPSSRSMQRSGRRHADRTRRRHHSRHPSGRTH